MTDKERILYWEGRAKEHEQAATYYKAELVKAHALVGRVIHQLSERWDTVRLTEFFPTDNLWNKRTGGNPSGDPEPLMVICQQEMNSTDLPYVRLCVLPMGHAGEHHHQ